MEPQSPRMITIPAEVYVQIIKRIETLEEKFEGLEQFQTDSFDLLHSRLERLEQLPSEKPQRKKMKLESSETLEEETSSKSQFSLWNDARRLAMKQLCEEGVTAEERAAGLMTMRKGSLLYEKTKIVHENMFKEKAEKEKAEAAAASST